jgi:DNA polymerase-3 subunit epsilon
VADAVIVIAHNAGFDRKFAERYWPILQHKAWAARQPRSGGGNTVSKVRVLATSSIAPASFTKLTGRSTTATPCLKYWRSNYPLLESRPLPSCSQARRKTMRWWAEQSPFDLKNALKRRGYRWSDGTDGGPRSWYIDVDEIELQDEIAFLKNEIYRRDVEPRLQTLTAFTRFSARV